MPRHFNMPLPPSVSFPCSQSGFDYVTINGVRYSGSSGPQNVEVQAGDTFEWHSDGSTTRDGWTICLTSNSNPPPPPTRRPPPPPSGCDSGTSNVPQIQCGDTVSVNIAGNNDFHPYMLDLRNQRGNTQVLLSTCGSEVEDPDLCFYQEYIDDDQSKFEFASPPTPSSTCARQLDF